MDIVQLLSHGTGTAIAIIMVLFVAKMMSKLVSDQSSVNRRMAETLQDISKTMVVIKDNIKDLQTGQNNLWQEIRNLKREKRGEND